MKTCLYDYILLNAEGGAGGGGGDDNGDGGGADPGSGDGGAENGGNETGDGGGGEGGYRPEGLPDNLFGGSDQETIDKLAAAIKGYRQKDNERGVPGELADYGKFEGDIPEEIAPYIGALSEDTAFQKVAEVAKAEGIPVQALQKLTMTLYGSAHEMGLMDPFVDVKAEQAALVPEDARNLPEAEQRVAREKRMNENYDFIDLMTEKRENQPTLDKDVAEYVKASLGDTAKGHQFFEFMRNQITGGNKIAGGGPGEGGQDAYAALQARIREPKNTPDHRDFDRASYEQLKKDLQAYHAQNGT